MKDWQKNLLSLPWVKPVKGDVRCEGIKWSGMSIKGFHEYLAGNTAEKYKCKHRAKVVLTATKRTRKWDGMPATSGSYCLMHASMQISDHEPERRRADKFFNTNGWWRNGVFGIHNKEEQS